MAHPHLRPGPPSCVVSFARPLCISPYRRSLVFSWSIPPSGAEGWRRAMTDPPTTKEDDATDLGFGVGPFMDGQSVISFGFH